MTYWIRAAAGTSSGPIRNENQDVVVLNGQITQRSGTLIQGTWPLDGAFSAAIVEGKSEVAGGAQAALVTAGELSRCHVPANDYPAARALLDRTSTMIAKAGEAWDMPDMGSKFAMLTLRFQDGVQGLTLMSVGGCSIYSVVDESLWPMTADDGCWCGSTGIGCGLAGVPESYNGHVLAGRWNCPGRYLICSDGVSGVLSEDRLAQLCSQGDSTEVVRAVLNECWNRRAQDNCSAIAIEIALSED